MNQDLDRAIHSALTKNEATAGIGSSATANEIMKVVKPYYKNGTSVERQEILARINKLREQPGVPFPINVEQLLNN